MMITTEGLGFHSILGLFGTHVIRGMSHPMRVRLHVKVTVVGTWPNVAHGSKPNGGSEVNILGKREGCGAVCSYIPNGGSKKERLWIHHLQ